MCAWLVLWNCLPQPLRTGALVSPITGTTPKCTPWQKGPFGGRVLTKNPSQECSQASLKRGQLSTQALTPRLSSCLPSSGSACLQVEHA